MAEKNEYNWERVSELFDQALEIPHEKWVSWIDTQCNDQEKETGLHTYVLKLLKGSVKADAFFEALNKNIEDDLQSSDEVKILQPGDKFDKFRIISELGHGGMARVFLCERDDGTFEHKVALKIMKIKEGAEFLKDKFRQEQQILAGINHPNIARLYDGGITPEGFPFIIMEYVEGLPINTYCTKNNLNARQRIQLFTQVCNALQYAHINFIVHHDIKPANILVNDAGQVKLLDFGISQVLYNQEMQTNNPTSFEGTLQYAAPEQFKGAGPSIASDIYKTGLVLYEILTGTTYNSNQTGNNFIPELKNSSESEILFGKKSFFNNKLLQEDLDAILKKSLALKPESRFISMSSFIYDLQNSLNNETLHSHEPTLSYKLKKSYLRNKGKVWLGIVFNVALIVSFIFLADQYYKTLREKERSEHILEFVWDIFYSVDPEATQGDTLSVYQLMENSIPRIEKIEKEPELQAELYHMSGKIYTRLGFWKRGQQLYVNALDVHKTLPASKKNDLAKAEILSNLAHYYRNNSENELADSVVDLAITTYRTYNDPKIIEKHAEALNTKARIQNDMAQYQQCIEYSEQALILLNNAFTEPHIEKIRAKTFMAYAHFYLSQYDDAFDHITDAIAILEEGNFETNSITLLAEGFYSRILAQKGEIEAAIENDYKIYRQKVEIYGENKPITLVTLSNLAAKYYRLKDYEKSDSINLVALRHYREQFGDYHSFTASTLFNLANSYYSQRKFAEAKEYIYKSMDADIATYGENHPYVAGHYQTLGLINLETNEHNEAGAMFFKALDILKYNFGEEHQNISKICSLIGDWYLAMNDLRNGHEYYQKAIDMSVSVLGEDHPETIKIKEKYASITKNSDNI